MNMSFVTVDNREFAKNFGKVDENRSFWCVINHKKSAGIPLFKRLMPGWRNW